MKHIFTISRILLGLIFVIFGLNGFLHFIPTTQFPGPAGQFIGAIFSSHFYIVVFGTQVVGGLLMLANRLRPVRAGSSRPGARQYSELSYLHGPKSGPART